MDTNVSSPVSSSQPSAPSPAQGSQQGTQSGQPQGGAEKVTAKSVTQAMEGKPTAQPSPELFEVKVNGKVVKMTRQELIDNASMVHAANGRFDEASKLKKSVDKIISTAKSNPIQALMDPALGLTKDQIRSAVEDWYHKEFIEAESLSPAERRSRELEEKLKGYEDEKAEQARQKEQAEETELTNRQKEYLQGQIIDALDRSGLPKTAAIASRVAYYMRENMRRGWEAPLDLIVKQVKEERQTHWQGEVGGLEGDSLIQYLGEDVVNKIRKHDLQRLRDKRSAKSQDFTKSGSSGDGYGNSERISSSDVTKNLRDLRMGKKKF